jgi:hypothetical protein
MSNEATLPLPRPIRKGGVHRVLLSGRFWAIVGLLLAGLAFLLRDYGDPPFSKDKNLVKTTRATGMTPPMTSLMDRARWKFYEFKRSNWPDPLSSMFPASGGPSPCSVHGLLNQCLEVGGTEYFIEKSVAAGSVNFGSTKVLNGAQWIAAFESALQNDRPEWWDAEKKGFRKENLVLLRYNKRTVLVLSPATAKEYQNRYSSLKPIEVGRR